MNRPSSPDAVSFPILVRRCSADASSGAGSTWLMIPCSVDAALHVAGWAWQAVSSHVALAAGGRHSWDPRPQC